MTNTQRNVTILGATGTIGVNTLDIISRHPERFTVKGLTAGANVERLIEQAKQFRPSIIAIEDETKLPRLQEALSGEQITILAGKDGINAVAEEETDIVISAIVGAAALSPTLAAIRKGRTIGLANKECLVCAGDLMLQEVKQYNARILPIDSEHNALYQCFENNQLHAITGLTLTASGGPFRTRDVASFNSITPADAVNHPNWSMGAKISVDSATMVNKGLEVIEAYYLFPVEKDQIDVIIHPQSIVHGLVHYADGSSLANLSGHDMRVPISYALGWPERITTPVKRIDLATLSQLTFEKPDTKKFPALQLAHDVLREGGSAPLIYNAANEIAVDAFLKGEIPFTHIFIVLHETLSQMPSSVLTSLAQVYDIDDQARRVARNVINQTEAA